MIRVVLADDQALVRSGLRALLANSDDIQVVGEASDGREAVAVVTRTQPDVVLMDVRMPGVDGIAATQQITADQRLSGVAIIMLTTFDEDEEIFAAIRAGASGYLLKDAEPDDLREAIRIVADGDARKGRAVRHADQQRQRCGEIAHQEITRHTLSWRTPKSDLSCRR